MRGRDYRSNADEGVALLICSDFPSKRLYQQALGRVGRYGEPCKRARLQGFDPVNAHENLEHLGRLTSLMDPKNQKKMKKDK